MMTEKDLTESNMLTRYPGSPQKAVSLIALVVRPPHFHLNMMLKRE